MHVLTEEFRLAQGIELSPRFNIAPTQQVPVIRPQGPTDAESCAREITLMRWGLIPSWAKDPSIGARLINARAETIAEKPSFRSAFKRRRCLIPADGYYEWQKVGSAKQPYWIHRCDERPFVMAGLWESWASDGSAANDPVLTCTIVTTEANTFARAIHDRMPVILTGSELDTWLDPQIDDREILLPLLHSCDENLLTADPVSTHVNNPRHDDPACIQPSMDTKFG